MAHHHNRTETLEYQDERRPSRLGAVLADALYGALALILKLGIYIGLFVLLCVGALYGCGALAEKAQEIIPTTTTSP